MYPPKYEQELIVPCYFHDINRLLRPAAFFDLAQEAAQHGAAMVGAGDSILGARGLAWILVRMHVHYFRLPGLYEPLRLQTWHAGVSGPLYIRDYQLRDASGEVVIAATSSWALMEMNTRSLARADSIFDILPPEPQCSERAVEANATKVVWPRGAEPESTVQHTVGYSEIDYNGHANNARYPVWAYDCLPPEVAASGKISDFDINFNHELRLGQTVGLACMRREDGSYTVEGRHEDQQNFICRMVF